ncbi:MAG: hypothetical protein K1X67_03300 [Fimbriimonadaceae bacterium]|nr:hypothetical protein [Fimbriimonadaceae bacterium]
MTRIPIRPIWILLLALCLGLSSAGARAMARCANECGAHSAGTTCCGPKKAPPTHQNCPCCADLDAASGTQAMAKASLVGIPLLVVDLAPIALTPIQVVWANETVMVATGADPPADPPLWCQRCRAPPLD